MSLSEGRSDYSDWIPFHEDEFLSNQEFWMSRQDENGGQWVVWYLFHVKAEMGDRTLYVNIAKGSIALRERMYI